MTRKFNLLLNSSNCTNLTTFGNEYTYNFPKSITIKPNSKMNINQIILPYSMQNVASYYGNNSFTLYVPSSVSGFTSYSISLKNGFYTVSDLDLEIKKYLYSNGLYWYSPFNSKTNIIRFSGNFSSSTSFVVDYGKTNSQNVMLTVGMYIQFINTLGQLSYAQITGLTTSNYWYTVSSVSNYPTTSCAMTAFDFDETNVSIIYPINISTATQYYGNQIQSYTIPLTANIQSSFGYGFVAADGNFNQNTWFSYPTYSDACCYIVFPSTSYYTMYGINNNISSTIGNLLGFYSDGTTTQYPSSNTSLTTNSQISYSNSLAQTPSFPPVGSNVNAIIVRCNIVDNEITRISDILDFVDINATYGSNIIYKPSTDNSVKLKEGNYSNFKIILSDQNNIPLILLDSNVIISLCITMDD